MAYDRIISILIVIFWTFVLQNGPIIHARKADILIRRTNNIIENQQLNNKKIRTEKF